MTGNEAGRKRSEGRTGFEMPDWHASMKAFRTPSNGRASWQLINTILPYFGLWALMILSIRHGYPYAVTLVLVVVAALFLVRLFILFHDCVHGSMFPARGANTFFGHLLGLFVFTPFDDWRFSHLRHHQSFGDLDARGFGDIWTITRKEYEEASKGKRRAYRIYRNPWVLVGLGALFTFALRHRLPTRKVKRKERMSVLFTDVLIVAIVLLAARTIGWRTYLLIQLPVLWLAGAMGIWLFYVQHQFKGGYWMHRNEWEFFRAAMEGSSHYALPTVLRWFSSNIGYHHVHHHLSPRIPNYRLKQCYEAVPQLQANPAFSFRESLAFVHLKLWDEGERELVGFPREDRASRPAIPS